MLIKNEINTFRANGRYTRYQCLRLSSPRFMHPSNRCLKLMQSYEQLRTLPYDDQTSRLTEKYCPGATIGYGHLIKDQDEFEKFKNGISHSTASVIFEYDLYKYIQTVRTNVRVDLTQNEFDALVMMAFNIGIQGFKKSTVLEIINGLRTKNLRTSWLSFRYSQGKIMQGLINRRTSEMDVFFEGVYRKI